MAPTKRNRISCSLRVEKYQVVKTPVLGTKNGIFQKALKLDLRIAFLYLGN
jgi:hypothetical protein